MWRSMEKRRYLMMRHNAGYVLLVAGIVLAQGCGGQKAQAPTGIAKGHVTYQNKPFEMGTVVFSNPQTGFSMMAPLNAEGAYEFKTHKGAGLPPGRYQVAIIPKEPELPPIDPKKPPMTVDRPPVKTVIPPKYQKPATSGLTAAVEVGENKPFDFDISR
jgi:hypothetical protein